MRLWRNRQTRTFEGRMGNHPGSSPGNRTTHSKNRTFAKGPFFISGMGGAVTGRVHRMTPQGGDIRCTRLGNDTFIFFSRLTGHLSRRKLTILKCRIPFLEKSGISPDMTYLG